LLARVPAGRAAQLGGLRLQLQPGDVVTQWLQAALELQALLVGGTQLGRQPVVGAALGAQRLFALELECERCLQPSLCRSIVEGSERQLKLLTGLGVAGSLMLSGFDGAL
jgi:hypothetical protein